MYPVFNSLADALANDRIAWYLGLITYWLVWGMAFPFIIIGKEGIKALIHPQKPTKKVIIPMSIILVDVIPGQSAASSAILNTLNQKCIVYEPKFPV